MSLKLIIAVVLCLPALSIFAEEKSPVKFGKVTPADFEPKVYAIDSNANAVVIADIGTTEVVGSTKGWFGLEFKRFKRITNRLKSNFVYLWYLMLNV